MFLPHFDVFCDLLLNQRATWNLFVLYNNEKPFSYFKIFQHSAKAGLLPRLWPAFAQKPPFDVSYDLHKMKQFHWLLCVAKSCDWSRKIALLSNLTRASFLVKWKLTAKGESNCKICKYWRKCRKNQVRFCHRSSPVSRKAWTLPWKLQELKKYPRETCGHSQPRGHLIRVLNKRSVNDGGDFCLQGLVILKSAWHIVGDTF